MESITTSELLEALANATHGDSPAEARTCPEMAAEMGVGVDRVRRGLRALHAAGRLTVHRAKRTNLIGQSVLVPAYTIAPAKKRKK